MGEGIKRFGQVEDCKVMVSLGVTVLPSTEVLEGGDELGFLGEARSESIGQNCEDVVLLS